MKACTLHYPFYKKISAALVITFAWVPLVSQTQQMGMSEQASTITKAGIESKVAELDQDLKVTREELAQSREEIRQLRLILQKLEQHLAEPNQTSTSNPATQQSGDIAARVHGLEEGQSIIQ